MKKILLISTLALLAASCNQQPVTQDNDQNQNAQQQQQQQPQQKDTQTYQNATYNFRFDYPTEFKFVDPTYGRLKDQVVQIILGKQNYTGTNFSDAAFTVSRSNVQNKNECLSTANLESGSGFTETETINGVTFYKAETRGAATGNLYDSRLYRTYQNNVCFELAETIHTTNVGNYPPGTVTEVNKDPIWNNLHTITSSFKFGE